MSIKPIEFIQSDEKYMDAVERFADKYSQVKGVVSVEPDDFGADIIVVLIDDKRYKNIELPSKFEDYDVSTVGLYALQDTYEHLVGIYIVNEPSIWDTEYEVPFQKSLDLISARISSYEEKIDASINASLFKIKDALQWIIDNDPKAE